MREREGRRESREGVEEGKGAGHNFSEVEKATSQRFKKQLPRSGKSYF